MLLFEKTKQKSLASIQMVLRSPHIVVNKIVQN